MSEMTSQSGSITSEVSALWVRRWRDALAPRAIYLFGSHAYGHPHAGSDVDVLVVLANEEFSTWDVARRGYGAVDGLGLLVELHFTWPERLRERAGMPGSFEHEIVSKGRLLYAA